MGHGANQMLEHWVQCPLLHKCETLLNHKSGVLNLKALMNEDTIYTQHNLQSHVKPEGIKIY